MHLMFNVRTVLSTLVVLLLLALGASAKEYTFHACTADAFHVALTIDLKDAAIEKNAKIPARVAAAFKATAIALRLDQFLGDEGFATFMSKLTAEDRQALPAQLDYPALLGNDCVAK